MISKAQIKLLRQLNQKKYREEYGLFIAEGPKIVNEFLNSKYKVREIYATEEFRIQSRWLSGSELKIQKVTIKELESISALTTPNQVLGVFEISSQTFPKFQTLEKLKDKLVLSLDDIRDPGNLGTIIRIADWFGIKNIFCSENCVDVYNPKVVQASMGSITRVDLFYVNLEIVLKDFHPVYGTVLNGKNIYSEKLSDNGIILIGNESKGISEKLMEFVTHKLSIPNFGKADSLNASIAAAIICSEFKRR